MRILPVIAAVTAAFLVVACSSPTPLPASPLSAISTHNVFLEHGMKSRALTTVLNGV